MNVDLTAFKTLAEALGIGLLVGIERYMGREPGEKRSAGVRTFALFAVLGAVCGLFEGVTVAAVVFAGVAALVVAGYLRSPAGSPGLTTEVAALLVFWLGVLLHRYEMLAIAAAIVLTIILAAKRPMHGFVRDKISEDEFFDTLKFLAVVLVVFPLLPDTRLGPYGFLNPRQAWLLVVLVTAIGYLGYVSMRWLGGSRGLRLTALAGGLISTSAATLALANRTRQTPELSVLYGGAALLANSVQPARLLVLLAAVDFTFAGRAGWALVAMSATGLLAAWCVDRRAAAADPQDAAPPTNPFSLLPALKFAAFLVGILLLVEVANARLGTQGVVLAGALAGLANVSAVALSLAEQVSRSALPSDTGVWVLLLALACNAAVKVALALIQGTRTLALYLGGGLALMLAVGVAVLLAL